LSGAAPVSKSWADWPTWGDDLIRTRTAEGRSRAQKRGQHMSRPPKLTAAQKAEARRRRAEGATLAELAPSYDVGKSTISRLTRY